MNKCRSVAAGCVLLTLTLAPLPCFAQASRSGPTFNIGGSASPVRFPDVAHDTINDQYLVVNGTGFIEGQLLNAAGVKIGGFTVNASRGLPGQDAQCPRVFFTADLNDGAGGYLVTWHETFFNGLFARIHGRLLSTAGTPLTGDLVLSPEITAITKGLTTNWGMGAAIAYSKVSREFLVTYMGGYTTTNDIKFTRLDLAGTLLQASTTITAGTPDWERDPAVDYDPDTDEFLIAYAGWRGYSYIGAQRVKAGTGEVIGAARELIQTLVTYIPTVTYNRATAQYLVCWYNRTSASVAMYGVSLQGSDGAPTGPVQVMSARYISYDALDVKYNAGSGDFLLVTYGAAPQIWEDAAVSINSDGTPYDNGFIVTNTPDVRPVRSPVNSDGNFSPRIIDDSSTGRWLMVTSSVFTSVYGQFVASQNTGGGNPTGPRLAKDQSSLAFATVSGAPQQRTSPQLVRLTQTGTGTITWTASTSAPWLQVSPTSGTGSSVLTVSLAGDIPTTSSSASITIAATGAVNTVGSITASLTVLTAAASKPPVGAVDSPANNLTGVTGSMAITGWAIDDVDVTRVRILRDPVAGEAPGLVYIGDGMFVEGARPDVASLFLTNPQRARAGWGYLLLTNMLPALGNGTFKFYAYADDADGHSTLLGIRTVTCANDSATQPFGAVDTPAPGETVAGSVYTSFGWVLARGRRADPPGGGTVSVVIDGTVVGSPDGWAGRADLQGLFPSSEYPGISSALGVFNFDTTTLTNGMHTMAWVVTDNDGNASGVGSRYFRVFNGGSAVVASVSGASGLNAERDAARAVADTSAIEARRGYELDVPFLRYEAESNGRVTLQSEELDRIELRTHGATGGYLVTSAGMRPLPIGSRLDPVTGAFVWQPGVGFIGSYDLAFVRHAGGRLVRQDVRIVLNPKGSNRIGPQIVVDSVGDVVAGWAADLGSHADRGIDLIHVWAYPAAGGHPVFVGEASYGGERPDVAAIYGERFHATGYGIRVNGLEPGTYDLAIFVWSSAKHGWLPAKVVRIVVPQL